MTYSQFFVKKQARIPTFLSIFVVVLVVYFIGRFFLNPSSSVKATKKNVQQFNISNVFYNQAAVYWRTDKKEVGWIIYGEDKNNLSNIATDIKDFTDKKDLYFNHYVTLKDLKPNTHYYFKIASTDGLFEKKDGTAFEIITLEKSSDVANLKPAYGKVASQNGLPIENAVINLSVDKSSALSTLSKPSGEWLIPLNFVTDSTTHQLKILSGKEKVSIQIIDEEGNISKVNTLASKLSPLDETVVIGKNYSFLEEQVLAENTKKQSNSNIDILFPKADAIIPANNPLIKGTAGPNSKLTVSVTDGKEKTTTQVTTDKDGVWKLNLAGALKQGQHTLEVRAVGGTQDIKRNFSIAKSGEQVLGEATSEPTLTPTPTTTLTTTPSATNEATATPTPPVSGSSLFYLTLSSVLLIVIGLGLLFYGFI